jgi:hypothetical protein
VVLQVLHAQKLGCLLYVAAGARSAAAPRIFTCRNAPPELSTTIFLTQILFCKTMIFRHQLTFNTSGLFFLTFEKSAMKIKNYTFAELFQM